MIIKGLIIILAVAIAVRDFFHYKISNILLGIMLSVRCLDIIVRMVWEGQDIWILLSSAAGAFAGFIIFFSASLTKYTLGAGDIKYSTTVGFVLGFGRYLWAMLIGGGVAICYIAIVHRLWHRYIGIAFPYAPFISTGLIVMLLI